MRKLLCLLCALFAIAGCDHEQSDKPVVKIGASLPLSGDISHIGNAIKAALLMVQSDIPSNSKYKYEIVFDDDSYELRQIATNAKKQISVDKADAILSLFDGASSVIAPISESAKIPNIGCTWGADFYKKYDYSFNHWSRPETQSSAFVKLLSDNNIKSFSIVMLNYASTAEIIEHVKTAAKEKGIKITSVNIINGGEKDFRITIEKIRNQKPDAIMLQMLDPELGIFTRQAFQMGLDIPYVAIDQLHTAANKEPLNGAKFVLSRDGSDTFKADLAKRTKLPAYPCVANLVDAFNMIVSIYENSDVRPDGETLKDKLYAIRDFDSVLGGKVNVDSDGIIDSPLIRAHIENGTVVIDNQKE